MWFLSVTSQWPQPAESSAMMEWKQSVIESWPSHGPAALIITLMLFSFHTHISKTTHTHKTFPNTHTHTHSCIKAVITVLNNWSLVKLRGSRVSTPSLSLFRVDGWRGKSKLLMRVTHHVHTHMQTHTLHSHGSVWAWTSCIFPCKDEEGESPLKPCSFISSWVLWMLGRPL